MSLLRPFQRNERPGLLRGDLGERLRQQLGEVGFDLGGHLFSGAGPYYTRGAIPPFGDRVEYARFRYRSRQPGVLNLGKGDKRTFRGKVFKGSHGKTRPRKAKKTSKKPG